MTSFFKGKNVLLTGHTGFKGGWLSIWLDRLGAQLAGLALDPEHERGVFTASGIGQRMADYRQDLLDRQAVQRIFSDEQPEIVFHLAAQPLVLDSYRDPVGTFAVNTLGTAHVLEAVRQTPSVRAVVVVTSDKCYENREWAYGYRENDPMGGYDPYSASKGAAELITASYRRSFFQDPGSAGIASVRAGNVIGGGDWAANRLVPDLVRALEQGESLQIRKPEAVRPWQHVLDPLGGYLLLAEKLYHDPARYAEGWNFGPDTASVRSVRDLVEGFIAYLERGSWTDCSAAEQAHEANLLMLDISKARQRLAWTPTLSVEHTIALTADWYAHAKDGQVLDLCRRQIEQFEAQRANSADRALVGLAS